MVRISKQVKIIKITGPTNIVSVIGADTYFGSHMVKHLVSANQMVYGFSQQKSFSFEQEPIIVSGSEKATVEPAPIISDWLFVCVDPRVGFERYVKWMRVFCKEMIKKEYWGKICFLSLGSICRSECDAPISEDSFVSPRTELDLSLATAENMLSVMRSSKKNAAETAIVRIGVPYGNETGFEDSGCFINQAVRKIIAGEEVVLPNHFAKRSFTHISDICDSIIKVMSAKFFSDITNIPGEVLSIQELVKIFSEHFDFKRAIADSPYDDQDFFLGDQHLSDALFKETVSYNRKYSLRKWLKELTKQKGMKCLELV